MARDEQRTLASVQFDVKRKATRRHRFLQTMKEVMPWQELMKLVEPFYPKPERPGRPVTPLIWMLKLYFLQIWYGLSDLRADELMHDSHAVQEFLELDLGKDAPPDETTILRFRGIFKNLQYAYSVATSVNVYLHSQTLVRRMTRLTTG